MSEDTPVIGSLGVPDPDAESPQWLLDFSEKCVDVAVVAAPYILKLLAYAL